MEKAGKDMRNEIVWKVGEEERSCLTEKGCRTKRAESVNEAKECEGEKKWECESRQRWWREQGERDLALVVGRL